MRKLSWAPIVYLLLEALIIFLTIRIEPALLEYSSVLTILFGLLVVITNICFVLVHRKDPGFIPLPVDSIAIPDQSSRNDNNRKQHQSSGIISIRKRSTYNNNQSSREKEQINTDPSKNKNTEHAQHLPTLQVQNQELNFINEQEVSANNNVQAENNSPSKSKKDIELECEPSMQTDHENDIEIKSIPGSKQTSAEKNQEFEFISPKNSKQVEDDQVIKIEAFDEGTINQGKNIYQFEMSVKQRTTSSSKNEITTIEGSTKSTTKTNEHITTNNFNNILTQNNAVNSIFTNENNYNNYSINNNNISNNSNNIILQSKISDYQQGSKLDDSKLNYSVLDYPQTAIDINAKILNQQDRRNSINNKIYSFHQNRDQSSLPIPLTSPMNEDMNEIRLDINVNDQINFFQGRRQSKACHQNIMSEHDLPKDAQFIEIRHCMVCNIEQKIRSKHCKICNHCVATYDHHCPWIGNCVGEKNRCHFWWYLLFQFSEVVFAMVLIINSIVVNGRVNLLMFIVDIVLLSFFFFMVGSLFIYHTYLATENLTTWEIARWDKISYLKEWPEHLGSPFSRGFWSNIKQYCQCFKGSRFLVSWYIPRLNNQAENNNNNGVINQQQPNGQVQIQQLHAQF